ncbi:MAG: hypothetical protein ACTS6H_02235, partial [Candidatus Hodgkinia cicadicola]
NVISVFNGVRRLEIAIMAFGFAFHAFSSTSEVATFGGGLSLFAVKTSLSRRPSLAISCGCPLTRRDMLICGSTVTFCHKIGPGSNVLLHSANEVWGASGRQFLRNRFNRFIVKRRLPPFVVGAVQPCFIDNSLSKRNPRFPRKSDGRMAILR